MFATQRPATARPAMTEDKASESAMTALYRVALGPVRPKHYLPIFARFDATGRTSTGWNWAASLFTLGWLVFRQLWGPALVYVAVAEGLALLVFGVGRPLLQWPQAIEWGVLGAFGLLALAVPGLYGNAVLHTETRKKITRALAATRTVPEACALLESKASDGKRLAWVAVAHLLLAAAAIGAYFFIPQAGFSALNTAAPTASASPAPTPATATAVAPSAPPPAPASPPLTAPETMAGTTPPGPAPGSEAPAV
ncbi:MAG: DUF2628 domain-containing protein, partial [Burkholderiaceae bacterium]|nr:DUF2628 domain-containing protein [Burkholderiaceae bacterium]